MASGLPPFTHYLPSIRGKGTTGGMPVSRGSFPYRLPGVCPIGCHTACPRGLLHRYNLLRITYKLPSRRCRLRSGGSRSCWWFPWEGGQRQDGCGEGHPGSRRTGAEAGDHGAGDGPGTAHQDQETTAYDIVASSPPDVRRGNVFRVIWDALRLFVAQRLGHPLDPRKCLQETTPVFHKYYMERHLDRGGIGL